MSLEAIVEIHLSQAGVANVSIVETHETLRWSVKKSFHLKSNNGKASAMVMVSATLSLVRLFIACSDVCLSINVRPQKPAYKAISKQWAANVS